MFNKGDYVVYGMNGVCRVADIKEENFSGKRSLYYILEPAIEPNSVIYAPTENGKVNIRALSTEEEIQNVLNIISSATPEWEENDRVREEGFKNTLRSGVLTDIALMAKSLYLHKLILIENGRKLRISDANALKSAEEFVLCEFAQVMGTTREEALEYILYIVSGSLEV